MKNFKKISYALSSVYALLDVDVRCASCIVKARELEFLLIRWFADVSQARIEFLPEPTCQSFLQLYGSHLLTARGEFLLDLYGYPEARESHGRPFA